MIEADVPVTLIMAVMLLFAYEGSIALTYSNEWSYLLWHDVWIDTTEQLLVLSQLLFQLTTNASYLVQ